MAARRISAPFVLKRQTGFTAVALTCFVMLYAPIITLALTSQTIDLRTLSDLADTIMAPRLSEVTGVGHVSVQGGIRPAIRIQADLSRLASYGIALEDLRTAILLREVEGLSYEEIAQAMDCPVGTVRSRIFRAREVLLSRLSKDLSA